MGSASNAKMPLNGRASFYYFPMPTGKENNPLAMYAFLLPFVNGTGISVLNLTLTANFASAPLNISFLFKSTFHVVVIATYNSTEFGNGKGTWTILPSNTNTGLDETTVEFKFIGKYIPSNYTYFESEISLGITRGLPYVSLPGRYDVIFPFDLQEIAGEAVREGYFTVCPPTGFSITNSNQPYLSLNYLCEGSRQPYQFSIVQSQQLRMTFENSQAESGYSFYLASGLFCLGVGVPLVVSAIPLTPTETIDYDKLAAAIVMKFREARQQLEDG